MKTLVRRLLEPRSFILGITAFYFVWASTMWTREPLWAYHREMFIATVLLLSATGLVINTIWSNLIAAVLGAQLPLLFFAEFWMLSLNAELAVFSFKHIETWIRTISMVGVTPILCVTLSAVILSFSVASILRRSTDSPPADV